VSPTVTTSDDPSAIAEFEADLANAPAVSSTGRPAVLLPFMGYLFYFVGIAQMSGGLVHYPLDPPRYTALAGVGLAIFLTGTIINEVVLRSPRPTALQAARVISTGIVLALGLGMVSGGAQHFEDFPQRSTVLIPVGLVLAYIGFVTHAPRGGFRRMMLVGGLVGATSVAAFFLLTPLADAVAGEASQGDHHGEAPAVAPQSVTNDPAPETVPKPVQAPAHNDSHGSE